MNIFHFTINGKKTLEKLPKEVQKRVLNKMIASKGHPNIFSVIGTLTDYAPATHKFRVGNYRAILKLISKSKAQNYFEVLEVRPSQRYIQII